MDDYTHFPFEMYTIDEIAQMLIQSVEIGDTDFVAACREVLKKRKIPEQSQGIEIEEKSYTPKRQ